MTSMVDHPFPHFHFPSLFLTFGGWGVACSDGICKRHAQCLALFSNIGSDDAGVACTMGGSGQQSMASAPKAVVKRELSTASAAAAKRSFRQRSLNCRLGCAIAVAMASSAKILAMGLKPEIMLGYLGLGSRSQGSCLVAYFPTSGRFLES